MSPLVITIWIGNLFFDASGQLAFKAAARSTGEVQGLTHFLEAMRSAWTWFGLVAYLGEFVLWLAFLSFVPLSKAVLLSSANIFVVMLGGRLLFGEPITPRRGLAALLIISGVTLVGL